MDKVAIFYDDSHLEYDFGSNHPVRPEKLKLTFELMNSLGYFDESDIYVSEPRIAREDELSLFHTQRYIDEVKKFSKSGHGFLDSGDTPAFKGCYETTCWIVGATLKAAELVMERKARHAFNLSGGQHHASKDRASGFCIFNDPAICISFLKNKYDLKRILYLDIDAHHGDGVMYGFYSDSLVLDIDFHEDGRYLFPGTGFVHEIGKNGGKGLKINCPLPPGTGDRAYLKGFNEIVPRFVDKYRPEIIIMQCGADSHYGDMLAHLELSTDGYLEMAGRMHEIAHKYCDGRIVMLGGGGYNLFNVPRCWVVTIGKLIGRGSDEKIPDVWRNLFKDLVREEAPIYLHDREMPALSKEIGDKIMNEVQKNIEYLSPIQSN